MWNCFPFTIVSGPSGTKTLAQKNSNRQRKITSSNGGVSLSGECFPGAPAQDEQLTLVHSWPLSLCPLLQLMAALQSMLLGVGGEQWLCAIGQASRASLAYDKVEFGGMWFFIIIINSGKEYTNLDGISVIIFLKINWSAYATSNHCLAKI